MRIRTLVLSILILTLVLPVTLTGCKQPQQPGYASSSALPQAPADDMGRVYFYRNYEPYARMQEYIHVNAGWDRIGTVLPGTFFSVDVPPGTHHFWASREEKGYLEIDVEPGQVYYVNLYTRQGILVPTPQMIQTSPEMALHRVRAMQVFE
jgi:hypothetical protein